MHSWNAAEAASIEATEVAYSTLSRVIRYRKRDVERRGVDPFLRLPIPHADSDVERIVKREQRLELVDFR